MTQPLKDAVSICKTILRNGYDAYVINSVLQQTLQAEGKETEIDIATELDFDELKRILPNVGPTKEPHATGVLHEGGVLYRFYPAEVLDGTHPELSVARVSPRLLKKLEERQELPFNLACPYIPKAEDAYDGFADLNTGEICFAGLPDETLRRNYLLGVRAIRFAANYHLPVEANSWMAIVRGGRRILDYVSVSDIMDEWRKVEAENLWRFVRLLFDTQIFHGLMPEVAALSLVHQIKNESGKEETVFSHTLETMAHYPEELPYDWYGTMACLFHDVGKLYTAEYIGDKWTFNQHHHVGAKVTRKILNRLRFMPEDVDLICHLVRHHMRFKFMLTDKGIRRFKALDEYPRLIEIARADLKAREGDYTAFNHNLKYLDRADVPEEMLEPLLNGNEIMEFTGLKPGPAVGLTRDALLQAQIGGEVSSVPEAVEFIRRYCTMERLS
jgi:poly(A) polymerase